MELLDVVNEDGVPTGETVEREAAHTNGIRHRTSHVWILRKHDGKVQVLLQKRSRNKDSYPGCYDISSAGHIPSGEGFLESALRELKEELGVTAKREELFFCGCRRFEFQETFHGRTFRDNQVSNVYALWKDIETDEITIQEAEVDSVLWVDWDKCIGMVENGTVPNCIWLEELKMLLPAIHAETEAV